MSHHNFIILLLYASLVSSDQINAIFRWFFLFINLSFANVESEDISMSPSVIFPIYIIIIIYNNICSSVDSFKTIILYDFPYFFPLLLVFLNFLNYSSPFKNSLVDLFYFPSVRSSTADIFTLKSSFFSSLSSLTLQQSNTLWFSLTHETAVFLLILKCWGTTFLIFVAPHEKPLYYFFIMVVILILILLLKIYCV